MSETKFFSGIMIVVRHAKHYVEDGKLTEEGMKQSNSLARVIIGLLAESNIANDKVQIMCGPSPRTVQTAMIIANGLSLPNVDKVPDLSIRSYHASSPEIDVVNPVRGVLEALRPNTSGLVVVSHDEIMEDVVHAHVTADVNALNYKPPHPNASGYFIDLNGVRREISYRGI